MNSALPRICHTKNILKNADIQPHSWEPHCFECYMTSDAIAFRVSMWQPSHWA